MRALATIPVLRMFDEAKAVEFYVGFLGFQIDFEHRAGENFPLFMQVSRAGCVVRLSGHHGDGSPGSAVTFQVNGVEVLCDELRARDFRYAKPGVERTEWGTLDLVVTDPFANRLTFSEGASPRQWAAPTVVPTLAYGDVPRAAAWLGRAFGFRERVDARLTWDGGAMTWMDLDDALIHLQTTGGHGVSVPRDGHATQALKVYVADVDAHFAQARGAGATIVSEPTDGFWGGRIYRATDLEGHPWEISQRGVDLAAPLWNLPPGLRRGV